MSNKKTFKKWAKKEGYRVFSNARDSYDMPSTKCVWEGWQAATDRAANLVSDEGPVIGNAGVAVVVAKIREGNE